MRYMKKKFNIIMMIALALVFLIIIIFLYKGSFLTKFKTIQLDNALFNSNVLSKDVKVKNIKKIAEVSILDDINWYSDDEIFLSARNKEKKISFKYDLASLNIKNGSFSKILSGLSNYYRISPNKEKIVYYDYNSLEKKIMKSYDIKSKSTVSVSVKYNDAFLAWVPDSSGYIGISDGYLYKYDFVDKTRKNILDCKKNNIYNNMRMINISRDGRKFYTLNFNAERNTSTINSVDLKSPKAVSKIIEGRILNYELLNNEALIINGEFDGKKGIYYYDINKKKLDILVNGYCYDFKLSSDKTKIAYSKINDSDIYILCSAEINKNKIQNNIEVFNNNNYITYFEWNSISNKLAFVVSQYGVKDYLYIAEFK